MKSDETLIEIFLDFLNDKTADARKTEERCMQHPYVRKAEERGFPFQRIPNYDYSALRGDFERELNRVRLGNNTRMKKKIVSKLNDLQLNIPLRDKESGLPLCDENGKQKSWPILAVASFHLDGKSIEIGTEPLVNGMEFYGWYALLLISRISGKGKVKRCKHEACRKWYNSAKTGTLGFCSTGCRVENNRLMQRRRAHNRRHPDEPPLPIIRATAEKPRKG
jgi:hypothetical protein